MSKTITPDAPLPDTHPAFSTRLPTPSAHRRTEPGATTTLQRIARRLAGGFAALSPRRGRRETRPETIALLDSGAPVLWSDNGGVAPRKSARIERAPAILRGEMAHHATTLIEPPVAYVARIAKARISAGVVQLSDGRIIEESLVNTEELRRFGRFRRGPDGHVLESPVKIAGRLSRRPHVLLKQQYDANYGHWLVEALPRLAVVEDHYKLRDLAFIVSGHHGPMQAIYEDSLALFGVAKNRIVEIGDESIQVDDLIYPVPITCHPWQIAPRCIDVLEQLAARVRPNPGAFQRLYVSRNNADTRHLLNEREIIAIAERYGFVVVEPERLSLYEQIGLFRSARVVVGPQGAALTNALFADREVTLFALATEFMQDDFFSTAMSLKKGRFLSQHGPATDPDKGLHSHFTLDPVLFESLLLDALQCQPSAPPPLG